MGCGGMRFERKDDCYLDARTGLEWSLDNIGPLTWDEAMRQYPSDGEWRLPTVNELIALVDFELTNPATELPGMEPSAYWSSTAHAYRTSCAWYVYFYNGYDDWNYKYSSYYVRAVRGGNKINCPKTNGSETITVTLTKQQILKGVQKIVYPRCRLASQAMHSITARLWEYLAELTEDEP